MSTKQYLISRQFLETVAYVRVLTHHTLMYSTYHIGDVIVDVSVSVEPGHLSEVAVLVGKSAAK